MHDTMTFYALSAVLRVGALGEKIRQNFRQTFLACRVIGMKT